MEKIALMIDEKLTCVLSCNLLTVSHAQEICPIFMAIHVQTEIINVK